MEINEAAYKPLWLSCIKLKLIFPYIFFNVFTLAHKTWHKSFR